MFSFRLTLPALMIITTSFLPTYSWSQTSQLTHSRKMDSALKGMRRIHIDIEESYPRSMHSIEKDTGLDYQRFVEEAKQAIGKAGMTIVESPAGRHMEDPPTVALHIRIDETNDPSMYLYSVRIFIEEPVRLRRTPPSTVEDAITWEGITYTDTVPESKLGVISSLASRTLTSFLNSYKRANPSKKTRE